MTFQIHFLSHAKWKENLNFTSLLQNQIKDETFPISFFSECIYLTLCKIYIHQTYIRHFTFLSTMKLKNNYVMHSNQYIKIYSNKFDYSSIKMAEKREKWIVWLDSNTISLLNEYEKNKKASVIIYGNSIFYFILQMFPGGVVEEFRFNLFFYIFSRSFAILKYYVSPI